MGVPVNLAVDDGKAYVADGIGGMCIISLSGKTSAVNSDTVQKPIIPVIAGCTINTSLFKGLPAEKYNLNADKTLAILNNVKSTFTQTFTVVNTNDTGAGSLRWCLENCKAGGSRLKGTGPTGEGNVFIKSGNVWIIGSNATDNIIVGNNVGVDADGVTPAGNNGGLDLREGARNVVGINRPGYGNLVGDNHELGISAMGATFGNLIEGNYVGTDITGTKAIGNRNAYGISCELGSYGNIIRNNVTCANSRGGVNLWDGGVSYNVIVDNSIGLGADGKTELPNPERIFSFGGGVGGGAWYNVISGNKTATNHKGFESHDEVMGEAQGVYDTVFNGEVHKYSNLDRY